MTAPFLPSDELLDAVYVAQQHGTTAAAQWLGVSTDTMRGVRRQHDPTYTRGPGRPTTEEVLRAKPRAGCNCGMCVGHRGTAEIKRQQSLLPRRTLPVVLGDRPDWMAKANCAGMDPEVWFPGRGRPTGDLKAICAACEVRGECREYGLDEKFGMWGGLSERERRRARRARRGHLGAAS